MTNLALENMLDDLTSSGFWGKLELSFENGKVVNARRSENLKPPFYYRDNREEGKKVVSNGSHK